jgi:16S rRNA (guanine966-N2)-methyltransferase
MTASVKVIAGTFKGQRLATPRGVTTRPTADQVRIALMDILAPRLAAGARVLDVYAGAGGVGLEALSRGAAHVTFVERDGNALTALRRNIETLAVGPRTRLLAMDAERALRRLVADGERFDIVFLDPPYETGVAEGVLATLDGGEIVHAGGMVIVQHFTKRPPGLGRERLRTTRTRRFGETTLTFYEVTPAT